MRPVDFLDAVRESVEETARMTSAPSMGSSIVLGACILCAGFLIADAIDKLTASERGA
jgi:hypothetical protein